MCSITFIIKDVYPYHQLSLIIQLRQEGVRILQWEAVGPVPRLRDEDCDGVPLGGRRTVMHSLIF